MSFTPASAIVRSNSSRSSDSARQTLRHPLPVIKEVRHTQWSVKVDIVDAPELVLVLPARKEVFRGPALERLVDLCRQVVFEAIRREPFHRLSFEDWQLAKTFDNAFPQAAKQLLPWQQVDAQDSYRETHQYIAIGEHAAIYADNGACDSVTFARALAFSRRRNRNLTLIASPGHRRSPSSQPSGSSKATREEAALCLGLISGIAENLEREVRPEV